VDVDVNRSVKINLMPENPSGKFNPLLQVTFGERIWMEMPLVEDPENDTILITIHKTDNFFLNLYPVIVYDEKYDHDMWSDPIIEGYNSEVGSSTITVTWSDARSSIT
jgi:hypothetical protein